MTSAGERSMPSGGHGRAAHTESKCGSRHITALAWMPVVLPAARFPSDTRRPGDSAAARYGVAVVPTVLLLSAEGRVVARRAGESSETLAASVSLRSRAEAVTALPADARHITFGM